MKTLLIFSDNESPLQYLIIEEDFSRFHDIVINSRRETRYEDEFKHC